MANCRDCCYGSCRGRRSPSRKKIKDIDDPEERAKFIADHEEDYKEKCANPYQAASLGYIDDIIEPMNSRFRIIRGLQSLATKKLINPPKKHSNIPYKILIV